MTSKIPQSSKAAFKVIREIIEMGEVDLPNQFQGSGAPGDTLEYLCNVKRNNADSPDLLDWEIKFHGGNALLTLFHKDPQPNVTAGQLVALFRLLYEVEPSIFNVKDQAELRTFINNNFITSRTRGEGMSEKKTANHFSDTNAKDMKHWVDILKKMRESAQGF